MFGNKFLLLIGHKKNDIQNRLINLLHKISIMAEFNLQMQQNSD